MALVYVDSDPWLNEHDTCEKLYREIMGQLTARNRERKTSDEYARLSSSIRLRMKQYSEEVRQLRETLSVASSSGSITMEEAERRTRQIEVLQSREVQLQNLFHNREVPSTSNRAALLKPNVFADMGTTGWGGDGDDYEGETETTQTRDLTVDELREQQQQILRSQDEGLEELSKVISRQKSIATTINAEVDFQNDLLDDIADNVDNTDVQMVSRTQQIRTITRKDKTFVYWIFIVLLFIGIIVAALT